MADQIILSKLNQLLSLQSEVLSVEAFCLITGWSKGHVYKKTSKGLLPFYKPFGKTIYFKKSEIEKVLLQNRTKGIEEIKKEAHDFVIENLDKI